MEDVAVMGVSAVLARLPTILDARRRLQAALDRRPTLALFVDGPSLHLPLATAARAAGVPTMGLVCPQVWAWKPERTATVARAYQHLMCLFDFEPALVQAAFAVHGGTVAHVGHPVVDRLPPASERKPASTPVFGLAPGSRAAEIERHLGPFLEVARTVRQAIPGARFRLAGRRPDGAPDWLDTVDDISEIGPCHAVLTKSGTVTLELAWMGVPMVVAHSVSPLTHAVGRLLVRHVDHIALPNVLNRAEVVPEYIGRWSTKTLADALLAQVGQPPVPLSSLGPPGATHRIAARIGEALLASSTTGLGADGRLPGAP